MPPAKPTDAQSRPARRQTQQQSQQTTAEPAAKSPTHADASEPANLGNAETQAEYWRAYLVQLSRRACPGCGDDGAIF